MFCVPVDVIVPKGNIKKIVAEVGHRPIEGIISYIS